MARRTPWWLLLLRLLAVAAVILAFAAPVWRPAPQVIEDEALLIVMDAGATAAPGAAPRRPARRDMEGGGGGRPVAVLLADGRSEGALPFGADDGVAALLRAAAPQAWPGAYPDPPEALLANAPAAGLRTLWLSDGLDHPGRAAWLAALTARGPVSVVSPTVAPHALRMIRDGAQPELRIQSTNAESSVVLALGPDPQGIPREPGAADTRRADKPRRHHLAPGEGGPAARIAGPGHAFPDRGRWIGRRCGAGR